MDDLSNLQGQPNFNLLDPRTFESLCTDVIRELPGVTSVHRNNANSQHGVDALAFYDDGRVVAFEFKRYDKGAFDAGELRKACDRYVLSAEYWKEKGVSEFFLLVSSELPGTTMLEFVEQRKRFADLGIKFDIWSGSAIYAMATQVGATEIFQRYFPVPLWRESRAASTKVRYVDALLMDRIEVLSQGLSVAFADRLESARIKLRSGRVDEVEEAIAEVNRYRNELPASDFAEWLRLAARVNLRGGELTAARQLADQARNLDAENEANERLSALIELNSTNDVERALAIIENVVTPESLKLKALLLLALGNVESAAPIIEALGDVDNPETLRLRAILAIAEARLPDARQLVNRGLEMEAENEGLQQLRGFLLYFEALVQPPRNIPDVPDPADWITVRDDSVAKQALKDAVSQFDRLLKIESLNDKERAIYAYWRMACLGIQREKQADALDAARALLQSPLSALVLEWIIVRRWNIDIGPYLASITESLDQGQLAEDPRPLCAVVDSLLLEQRAADAQKLLNEYRPAFDAAQARDMWLAYFARTHLELEDFSAAIVAIDQTNPDFVLPRLAVRRTIAAKSGDSTTLIDFVKSISPERPLDLLECCDVMASLRDWTYVSERADELLLKVPNITALHIAATSLYNAGEMGRCIGAIARAREVGIPASDFIERLEVLARLQLGELAKAVAKARVLSQQSPTAENLLTLAGLEWRSGNHFAVVESAKAVLSRDDVAPESYLRLAAWTERDDIDLSRSLWRRSLRSLPDQLVPAALTLAYKLELESETKPLTERFAKLGAEGQHGVQAVSTEKLKEVLLHQRDFVLNAAQLYDAGSISAAVFADARNMPLSYFYFSNFETARQARNLAATAPVYVVSGVRGRHIATTVPKRLRMDLSALLLASHFGFLDAVERFAEKIVLPHDAIALLEQMRHEGEVAQPARIKILRFVIDRVDQARIAVALHADDAVRVVFNSDDPDVCQWEDIIEALERAGVATRREWQETASNLSFPRRAHSIRVGASLYFDFGVLEAAPDEDLVDLVSRFFRVSLNQSSYEHDTAKAEEAATRSLHTEWLEGLIKRISDRAGLYIFAQGVRAENLDADAASKGLVSILLRTDDGEALWIDDRFANRWTAGDGGIAVLSSVDLLRALRQDNRISTSEHYRYLRLLRESNAKWIPIEADELTYYIERAVAAEGFEPSEDLMSIRRYVASAALSFKDLQKPTFNPNGTDFGEIDFVFGLRNAINTSILDVWKTQAKQYSEEAAAWIYRNLVFDVFPTFLSGVSPKQNNFKQTFAQSIAGFIVQQFPLIGKDERRKEMNAWYDQLVLEPLNGLNPGVLQIAAEVIDSAVASSAPEQVDEATLVSIARFVDDLPASLKAALSPAARILEIVGGKSVGQVVAVGDLFEVRELLHAVKTAIDLGNAEIASANDESRRYTVIATSTNGTLHVKIRDADGHEDPLDDPMYALFSTDDYVQIVKRGRPFYDMSNERFDALVESLAPLSAMERIETLIRCRVQSASHLYQGIFESVRLRGTLDQNVLFPSSLQLLMDHLRFDVLDRCNTFDEFVLKIAQTETWQKAQAIISGLPIKTPSSWLRWWQDHKGPERDRLLRRSLRGAKSPVQVFHLLRACLSGPDVEPSHERLARRILGRLLRDGLPWMEAFTAVLGWSQRILSFSTEYDTLAPSRQLMLEWAHAQEVFVALLAAGTSLDWIRNAFGNPASRSLFGELQRSSVDISSPIHFSVPRFLMYASAFACCEKPNLGFALRDALEAQTVQVVENTRVVRFAVLRDTTIMNDELGTFAKRLPEAEASLAALIGEESACTLSTDVLRRTFDEMLLRLRSNPDNAVPWVQMGSTVGNSGPYEEARTEFQNVINGVNFVELFDTNQRLAQVAINTVLLLATHVPEFGDLRLHLSEALRQIAIACGKRYHRLSDDEVAATTAAWLLQSMINLWISGAVVNGLDDSISTSLMEVMYIWPATAKPFAQVLQRIFESERLDAAELLANAILFARASR